MSGASARRVRWWCAGGASLLLGACQAAQWSNLRVASPYHRPTYGLNVSIHWDDTGDDVRAYADALTSHLVDALRDDGLGATVDMESPASAQLRLHIVEWDPGDAALRLAVGHGAGEGHVSIVVDLKEPNGTTLLHGRVQGNFPGGIYGTPGTGAMVEATAIADAVSSGK